MELAASREVVLTGNPPTEVTVLDLEPTGSLQKFTVVTSSLVLGLTLAAMLLGHWYLNAPGMYVLITGRKPDKDADRIVGKAGDVFGKPGVKTLFALTGQMPNICLGLSLDLCVMSP